MRKITLFVTFVSVSIFSLNAQEFRVAINGGIPLENGNTQDFTYAIDVSYLWNVSDKVDLGITTGVAHWSGSYNLVDVLSNPVRSFKEEKLTVLPIAFTSRFNVHKKLSLGMDIGYALPIKRSYLDAGFYFAPKIQYEATKYMDVVLGYRVAKLNYLGSSNVLSDMLSIGFEFKL